MSTSDWPPADPVLERAYRRLLHAYPRSYRRRHGAEIVTTLLEMTEPGRRRPALSDCWFLVAAGLRQRFRLPSRRPLAWVAAVLALLAGGALGAAGASWAAEQTFTALPAAEQGREVLTRVTGIPARLQMDVTSGPPLTGRYLWGSADVKHAAWDPAGARDRLTADGWQVGPSRATDQVDVPIPGPETGFEATRDGLLLSVHGESDTVFAEIHVADNGLLRPAVVLGLLAGALGGWLIAAAVARRRSRQAAVAAVATFTVLFAPVWSLYDNTVTVLRGLPGPDLLTVHSVLRPSHYWPAGPDWMSGLWPATAWTNVGLVTVGLLLAGVTIGLSRARPGPAAPVREVAL
ncbi:hypothetical protein [Actinoplanes couchii]|uniref:Integral membrane protein n=1 Tax=Actinoplanes couchii TaxID=403638 RepID=A0ABQ3XLP0_9ACTN|nr:hypothetical protein [Actinoplanes couchii]MDR6319358.1 hypothetical protein [Actinoplanes couchii]GID59432.1 hypothetical protein Aco03nite_078360 [Actinoplanes couchii]